MRVYLDHNATSPIRPSAAEAVRRALDAGIGNPSSTHAEGRRGREIVEQARERVATLLRAQADEVVFTSGGSEAVAAAIRGLCDRAPAGRRRLVVGAVEHSCVLEGARLAASRGFEVVTIPCDANGVVDADAFCGSVDCRVALAALQAANNETGVIQPVAAVARGCRESGAPLLVDAVQAAGRLDAGPVWSEADLVAISSHKIGGPQGAGALRVRKGIRLAPLVPGGAQERRRRGGTEAVPALAGFGAAAEEADASLAREAARLETLRRRIEDRLRSAFPGARIHGDAAPRLANTVNVALPEVDGETLVVAMDLDGFAIATGSACASGAVEPSHVILAMGLPEAEARRAVRISLGWSTTEEDVERFLERLTEIASRARRPR